MVFTNEQMEELSNIIDSYHILFIGENIGDDVLTRSDRVLLKTYGLGTNFPREGFIETAFRFGMLSDVMSLDDVKRMSFTQLKRYLVEGHWLPLTDFEIESLEVLKRHAYSDIKGLGQRYTKKFEEVVLEEDKQKRKEYEKLIQNIAELTVENRKSVATMASVLGNMTEDWNRDFGRISDFVLHSAFDEGRAAVYRKRNGDESLVYKDVYPGACKECIRLYLTDGIGSEPRIFKLGTLLENGNNIRKKVKEWLPVVGPTHPWCRCTLNEVPEGYIWDKETGAFTKRDPNWVPKVKRLSKVIVTIGDKEYKV